LITHSLVQGTPQWKAYRNTKRNASDAPAMMGESIYKTRSQLLHEIFTGMTQEVDAGTQALFDRGHAIEDAKRSVAEAIIGEDLFPVVGSEGIYSASFDGITMLEDTAWECKTLNDALRAALPVAGPEGNDAANLPKMYRIQMEQQCMVSGCSKILFTASDGKDDDRHCWYVPDLALRAEIVAGWAQFEKDLAAYVPAEIIEKPKAASIMELPALAVQIHGEVLASNLPQFKAAADSFIAAIKTDLQTDEDFANAEATVKFCDKAEKNLELAKTAALEQTASIAELMRTVDHIQNQLRTKRLVLEKLVKTQKEAIKMKAVTDARDAYASHVAALEAEIKPIRLVVDGPDFATAAKNKRTLASLHDAIATELANGKIAADAVAKSVRDKLAWCKTNADGYGFLFSDLSQLIYKYKEDEDFRFLVTTRIQAHKDAEAKKEEEARERIRKEEEAKAQAKIEAEQKAQQAEAQPRMMPSPVLRDLEPSPIAHNVVPITPSTAPTLRLGQIGERLGFVVTADFLTSIGFPPAAKERSACLYHESNFPSICAAIVDHIQQVQKRQAA
jgi:predicted phage-related endonuclease